MEWAKVESRCSMCKRHFSSIRRPPKEGVFACERIVNVPVRDQIQDVHRDDASLSGCGDEVTIIRSMSHFSLFFLSVSLFWTISLHLLCNMKKKCGASNVAAVAVCDKTVAAIAAC
ncbi:uncharacterized protein LOC131146656 isoform X1 [Malania oleifera]|uniref:uncharacterized protein LOC131146656 isoform X1 n=1 Tax=Malania oleifera TaxID=397392 RepID=UPI0025AEB4E3|nr:uncharacterized protein LOC131146656 isoform X1 [Malania oleifera]